MPKDLTDVSQWETVEVPVGTDPATASSVETPLQILADRARYLLDYLLLAMVGSWFDDLDLTSVTGTDVPLCYCYDPATNIYTIGTADGYSIVSTGGLVWDDEGGGTPTGPNPGAGQDVTDMDANGSGRRLATADDGGGDCVFYSDALGTWTACVIGGTPGLDFAVVGSDRGAGAGAADVWLIADTATPSAVYRSPYGVTFAAQTVTGLTTRVRTILHTCDPANDCWVLMTDTQCARSLDNGLTWTTAAHGLSSTNQHRAVAYDRLHARFVVLIDGGRHVGYSDDNGATWTEVTNALPEAITGAPRRLVATDSGLLLAWCGTDSQLFASVDGGETWRRLYAPTAMASQYCIPITGGGLCLWAMYAGGWVIQRSLRGGE